MVSLGAKGCRASDGRSTVTAAARRVEVVDTIGAGDSFVAGFLHAVMAQAPLQVSPHSAAPVPAAGICDMLGPEAMAVAQCAGVVLFTCHQKAVVSGCRRLKLLAACRRALSVAVLLALPQCSVLGAA